MMASIPSGAPPAYGDWAALYQRYRPRYPVAVFELLSRLAPKPGVCVEIGAGSGQATIDLLSRFREVIAIEPDRDMAALLLDDDRLEVRVERAEDAVIAPRAADVVVAATSFHWMEQERVAKQAAGWLAPGGVFFAFGYAAAQYPGAPAAVTEVTMRYARMWRGHMHERLSLWRPYEDALRATRAYAGVHTFEIYADHLWTPEEAAGFLLSTSYGQSFAKSTGDAEGAREALEAELFRAAGGKPIAVRFPIEGAYGRIAAAN